MSSEVISKLANAYRTLFPSFHVVEGIPKAQDHTRIPLMAIYCPSMRINVVDPREIVVNGPSEFTVNIDTVVESSTDIESIKTSVLDSIHTALADVDARLETVDIRFEIVREGQKLLQVLMVELTFGGYYA